MTQFPKRLTDKIPLKVYSCADCGRDLFEEGYFCKDCFAVLPHLLGDICPVCGRRTAGNGLCLECKKEAPAFDRCRAAFDYYGQVRRLIFRMKLRNRPYLAGAFAPFLINLYRENGYAADAVCFIPMTKRALRRRGYNQAALIAKEVAEELSLPLLEYALTKVKTTKKQRTLNKQKRKENLAGTFRAASKKELSGKRILLIDDVITTGATLSEAAAALKKKGASKVECLAVAATPAPALYGGLRKNRTGRKPAAPLTLSLEKAESKDLSTAKMLIRGAKRHLKKQGIPQWQDGFPDTAVLKEDIASSRARILKYGGYPVGYCCLLLGEEPDYNEIDGEWTFPTPSAAMHRVALRKNMRGLGVSLALFNFAKQECKAAGFLSLRIDTHPQNAKMQRALSSAGFQKAGTVIVRGEKMFAYESKL